jgi:hypothetical protein
MNSRWDWLIAAGLIGAGVAIWTIGFCLVLVVTHG